VRGGAYDQSTRPPPSPDKIVKLVRTFPRFNVSQRWEHALLLLSIAILLLTGLPQKYNTTTWSQAIISTPERLYIIQQIHHIAALLLTALAIYHLGTAFSLIFRRKLPGDILPTGQDIKDAWNMFFLIFIKKETCLWKYNLNKR
jgi:hypothetical protein